MYGHWSVSAGGLPKEANYHQKVLLHKKSGHKRQVVSQRTGLSKEGLHVLYMYKKIRYDKTSIKIKYLLITMIIIISVVILSASNRLFTVTATYSLRTVKT